MRKCALATLAVLAFGALAQAKADWTGCYGGVVGSYNAAVIADVLGMEGPGISGVVGCDQRLGRFVVGGWAEYGWNRFEFATIDVDVDGWAAGGRAGYLVTPGALAYVSLGYTDVTAEALGGSIGADGLTVGGGAEFDLDHGFYLRTEYRYTTLEPDGATSIDANGHSGRVGLLYRFNAFPIK